MVDKDRKEESVLDNVCAQPRLVESLHRKRFSRKDRKSRHTTTEAEHYQQHTSALRIHEILVRIWIRGSIPLTNGSGSGSCCFRQ
jgi:hypothetical protein